MHFARVALIVALAVPLAGAEVTDAVAAPWAKKGIWGPGRLDGRSQFPIYRDLGVGIYHVGVSWASVSPTRPGRPRDPNDPAYRWPGYLDDAVREAKRYKIRVAINLTRSPAWANGGRSNEWVPRPEHYADFAEAAARRYRSVRRWIIWGEPSRGFNFQPMPKDRPQGPRAYGRILDAAYGRLKRVSRHNLVIGGNTFTTGDVTPFDFLKWMKLPNGKRPRLDLYGHNPFTARKPRLSAPSLGHGFADFGDLRQLARKVDKYYPPRRQPGDRAVRLYLSEFTAPMRQKSHAFDFFLSEGVAAQWLRSAFRIARWKRISALGWFELYDEAPRRRGDQAYWGLLDRSGRKKSVYDVYKNARP